MIDYDNGKFKATTTELLQILGVSLRTFQRLSQEGVFTVLETNRRTNLYDLAASVQAYVEYREGKNKGKHSEEILADMKQKKLAAEIALKESQSELHQMRTAIAAGKYIAIEEAQMDYSRFFVVFKKFALSLPSRIAGIISAVVDPVEARAMESEMALEVKRLLQGFVVAGKIGDEEGSETPRRRGKSSKAIDSAPIS